MCQEKDVQINPWNIRHQDQCYYILHTMHTDNKNILFSIFSIMIYSQYKKLINACVYLYF